MKTGASNEEWDRVLAERLSRKLRAEATPEYLPVDAAPAEHEIAEPVQRVEPVQPVQPVNQTLLSHEGPAGPVASGRAADGTERATGVPVAPPRGVGPESDLTPREEKRALDILTGRGRRGAAGVLVAVAAAVVASAGGAFLLSGGLRGEGEGGRDGDELHLLREMGPPPEDAAVRHGAGERSGDGPSLAAGPEGMPVFRAVMRGAGAVRAADRVDLGGPLVDLDLRPPASPVSSASARLGGPSGTRDRSGPAGARGRSGAEPR